MSVFDKVAKSNAIISRVGLDQQKISNSRGSSRPAHQYASVARIQRLTYINPTNSVSSSLLTNGGELSFRLERNSVGRIINMHCEIECEEVIDSNSVTLCPTMFMCSKIEIYGDNGSTLLTTLRDVAMYFRVNSFLTTEQQTLLTTLLNSNTAYAPTAISANTRQTYTLQFPDNPLDGINMKAVANDLQIKMTFRACVESGTGTLSTNSVRLAIHDEDSPGIDDLDRKLYQNYQKVYGEWHVESAVNQTLTASVATKFKIQSITGVAVAILVSIRAATGTALQSRTFSQLGNEASPGLIQIYHNGTSPLYNAPVKDLVFRKYESAAIFPSAFFHTVPLLYIGFGDNDFYHDGSIHGFLPLDGRMQIELTTGSAFSSGSYTVDFYVCTAKCLSIKNGKLSKINEIH